MLTVFARAAALYFAAVLAMRMMGKRQIGQLQPFELAVAVLLAELAAGPMGSVDIPLLHGLTPMLALVICHGLVTFLAMKSQGFRAWLSGQPTVLVRDGVICEEQLKKTGFTLNDLMEELRLGGVEDPAQVACAVLETGGAVSVFPKAPYRPLTPQDVGLETAPAGLPLPLILDGKEQADNLRRGGVTLGWLEKQLSALGLKGPGQVLFCCMSPQGRLMVQGKGTDQVRFAPGLSQEKGG